MSSHGAESTLVGTTCYAHSNLGPPLDETPEQQARKEIDKSLVAAGWVIQDAKAANLHAGRGVAVREAPLAKGHGFADYLLYVDQRACGAVEAKKQQESPESSLRAVPTGGRSRDQIDDAPAVAKYVSGLK